ncbi:hypothetical protein AD998_07450 [bacterium 336/3]|nr:hypothetical protein AD998_07450 [bacterium 336/3]
MSIRTFWIICIRIIGLWVLLDAISIIPNLILTLINSSVGLQEIGYFLFNVGFYLGAIQFLFFRTTQVVEALKLEKNFKEERIEFTSMNHVVILQMAIIVLGGFNLVISLAGFVRSVYLLLQDNTPFKDSTHKTHVVIDATQIIIYYLFMTNSRWFVQFFQKEKIETKE